MCIRDSGINMPRAMQAEFSSVVQEITDSEGGEVNSKNMWDIFATEFLDREDPLTLESFHMDNAPTEDGMHR